MSLSTDLLLPFHIEAGAIRGRLVRLGPALDEIAARHYPDAVARLLAETLTLGACLAGALKYDGIFTLQVQGNGPVTLLVADVTSSGDLRGYARFDAGRLAAARGGATVPALLGTGYMAFTVDQGPDTDRYQGIVELNGESLAECARDYFIRSEQLDTAFHLSVTGEGGIWQAGAVMVQRMPVGPGSPILTADEAGEGWHRAVILLGSLTAAEMLDPALAPERLLHRLFHAEGLAVAAARPLRARCRCSEAKVRTTLASFPRDQIHELKDAQGNVVVTCEFCRTDYVFGGPALDALHRG